MIPNVNNGNLEYTANKNPINKNTLDSHLKIYCNVIAIPNAGINPPIIWNTVKTLPLNIAKIP